MSAAHELGYEDWCDRLEPREPEDFDEHAYWASLLDVAEQQTGEHMAHALEGTDSEVIGAADENSGVFTAPEVIGVVEVTESIGGADEDELKTEAKDAIGFLSTDTRYSLTCDMLAALEPDRAVVAMVERSCRLPAEHQAILIRGLLEILANGVASAKNKANEAREHARTCECLLLDAVKPARHLMGGA